MPIYTNDPCDDGLFPVDPSLRSSIGIGPKVTKAIDVATKDWLDNHPEATTTVEDDSITNIKLKNGSVNSRTIENESIATDDIADLVITTPKIADNAVTSDKVASSAVDGLRVMSTTRLGVARVGAGLAMNGQALELDGNGDIAAAVTSWLNAHPEATTTIEDGAVTTPKLADGAVTDVKLAQTGGVLETVKTLSRSVFVERTSSGNVVEMRNCIGITSVSDTADGLTCVGDRNILPVPAASSQSLNGVTITTDGNGTYTITRTAAATSGTNIRFQLPEPIFVPAGVNVYAHQMATAFSNNAVFNLFDDNITQIYTKSILSGNAIVEASSNIGGKRIRYVGFYIAANFNDTITLSPMIMFTQAQSEYVEFGGISTTTTGVPSVPNSNLSYIWSNATSETPISVTYVTMDGGLVDDVARLEALGSKKQASGIITKLDHPSYIDGIYASMSSDAYTDNVVVVGGENLLPHVSERSVSSHGVVIDSDGSGGYTLTGTADGGENVFLSLEVPITFPDSEDTIYLHLRNDAINDETSIGLADNNRVQVGNGWSPSGINRVIDISSLVKGKTIAYISIYHSVRASYENPLHVHPVITLSSEASGSEVFEGVLTGTGDSIASVPSTTSCYVWAEDGTDLSVSYAVGIGYVEAKVSDLADDIDVLDNREIKTSLENARHIPYYHSAQPLTLLHFSDLHADVDAMNRIMDDASAYDDMIDGVICTGDIVANTAGQISGWWNSDVMTCIGNHDSASYSSGYDWTALSMADRDAYYIAPFESNWGITHTPGTSYYYKDYADSNVRLIVMDSMLYMSDSYASQASTQTAWLSDLLSDAITAGLHVLIAIHSIHDGAEPVPCSFTRIWAGTAGLDASCNTPQVVVDAVATAIGNGLDFIGYIVGHTHQDGIWDAEGDGTQMIYCITCAAVSYAPQWQNSDQHRSTTMDAYNLVTIDTNNKLVKIVRGGGANVDDKMRPRRMLCVSYDTGTVIGQEL